MALVFTQRKVFQSGTNASVYVVPTAFTPPSNVPLFAVVASAIAGGAPVAPTSITGNSLTWVLIDSQIFGLAGATDDYCVSLWRSLHASPTSGQMTITFGATQDSCCMVMLSVAGADTSGTNGSGSVVGAATKVTDALTDTLTTAVPTFASATNGGIFAVAKTSTSGMAPRAGWTEIGEQGATALRLQMQSISSVDTFASSTWAPSAAAATGGIFVEISEPVAATGWGPLLGQRRNRLVLA